MFCVPPTAATWSQTSRCASKVSHATLSVSICHKHYDVKPLHSHRVKQTLRCQAAAQSPCQLETLLGSAPLDISTVIASLCLDYISWYLCSALVCDDVTSAGTPLLIGVLLLNGGIGASSVPFWNCTWQTRRHIQNAVNCTSASIYRSYYGHWQASLWVLKHNNTWTYSINLSELLRTLTGLTVSTKTQQHLDLQESCYYGHWQASLWVLKHNNTWTYKSRVTTDTDRPQCEHNNTWTYKSRPSLN